MFIGEFQHAMDEKGRVAIPAKFRKSLKDGVVVTRGLDGALYIYAPDEWEKLAAKTAQLPINRANSRAFARHLLGGAVEAEIDSQGRILVPDYLRKHAGIAGKAMMVGLYNRIELWSEERWQEYRAKTEKSAEEIAESLEGFGT